MSISTSIQAGRSMSVATPLGPDALLLLGFNGEEGISQLFRFDLDLAAEKPEDISFTTLLGRRVTVRLSLSGGKSRYFNGICSRFSQGMSSPSATSYRMEVVPAAWLLTQRAQSRIFQNVAVPEILRLLFRETPDVTYDLAGSYQARDYCVQYRETDFNFASRLMQEEGIAFFFRHKSDSHEMVISDRGTFPALDPADLILQSIEDTMVDEATISHWEKSQELHSGKITLRDHTFELPHQNLEAQEQIPASVTVGQVEHRLRVGQPEAMELYDWPGEYAQRFDGLDRVGGTRPGELQKIFKDNVRTAGIRAEQAATEAIVIRGAGRYRHMTSGYSFGLTQVTPETFVGGSPHDGRYYLTHVSHAGRAGESYRSGGVSEDLYHNSFTCLPVGLKYRPPRTTPKPLIQGTQSAVVVGPAGEEIHTDKYGRIKVRFHWDRLSPHDDGSSCWIRVAQIAAGGGFGGIHIPRVGQEVVVQFEEGDPDRPIVVGSVYNPERMPPFTLPSGKMISGLRSNTYPGGGGLNEITVDDTKGRERMYFHAQFNQDTVVNHNQTAQIGQDSTTTIGGNESVAVTKNSEEKVGQAHKLTVGAGQTIAVTGNLSQTVSGSQTEHAREIVFTADTQVTIRCGASSITMTPASITIQAPLVKINC